MAWYRASVLAIAVMLAAAGCSSGEGGQGAGPSASPSADSNDPLQAEDASEDACTGESTFIEAVEIEGFSTEAVTIPEVKNEAGETVQEESEIPAREIPDQRIPAQCAEVEPAPAGCLGRASIPPSAIPPVTIPEVEIPALEVDGEEVLPGEAEKAVTQEGDEAEGDVADEMCQISEEEAGDGGLIGSVLRPSIFREGLFRNSAFQGSLRRPATELPDGTEIPAVEVPSTKVDAVSVDAVSIDSDLLESRIVDDMTVLEGDGEVTYNLDADVLFDTDSAEIRGEAADSLQAAADEMEQLPSDAPVRVEGHTDSDGDAEHNQDLSERRAQAVVDWLVDEGGLDADRFTATGHGESKPTASNDDEDGKAQNRRVMISAQT
ncbi:OmpA family protein [Nocardiopsis coralliicola]